MTRKIITMQTTKKKQVIDITDKLQKFLNDFGAKDGLCHLFLQHTTAALTIAELDPGTDLDLLDALNEMVPKLKYRHLHDPSHVPSHILSALIGTDLTLPFQNGKLILGIWQRAVLIEFEGPRERKIVVSVI